MSRRKLEERNVRKVYKKKASYCVVIPAEMARELKIRDGQKVEFSLKGKTIQIKDWKK